MVYRTTGADLRIQIREQEVLIAEMKKREKHLEEMFQGWRDEAIKASARIVELEVELSTFQNGNYSYHDDQIILARNRRVDMRLRIAELEAALKPFEEKFSKSLADAEKLAANEGYELPDDQTAEDIYAWALALTWGDLRAARAALNGES